MKFLQVTSAKFVLQKNFFYLPVVLLFISLPFTRTQSQGNVSTTAIKELPKYPVAYEVSKPATIKAMVDRIQKRV
ncbi:hypothetical protein [Pinibacter soli]|uniref:Uncharacterized protein n=1 Tax=Pinibacter soli TaxID=3044211 RepID=A0ABT6RET9_9BACT|nr:hypothetical protein [Pinibacter soli]MDI3320910.1 hypothetical protein [Pinibacter soli]